MTLSSDVAVGAAKAAPTPSPRSVRPTNNPMGAKTLYLVPAGLFLAVFIAWPTLYTIYLSFFDWNMVSPKKTFVGFDNYVTVFSDPITYRVLGNTVLYIVLLLVFNVVVPYVLAFVVTFLISRYQTFFKSALFLPSFISMVVGAIIYNWMLNPTSGPVAKILGAVGVELPNWSQTETLVILVICYVTAWKVMGYNFITLFASISGISKDVIENARLEGIPTWRMFIDIVTPMSQATGAYVLVMTIVTGLQYVYTPIKVMTQGSPNYGSSNLIYQAYHEAFVVYRTGVSAAYSVVTLVLFIGLLAVGFRALGLAQGSRQ